MKQVVADPPKAGAKPGEDPADRPSVASCMALLAEMPALTAYRRAMYRVTPVHARGMIGPLAVLSRHPDGLRLSQIADVLHIDLSVVSRHIAQMEEYGLVDRRPDPADRRASILSLTEAGTTWIQDVKVRFAERVRCYLGEWTDDDVAAFADHLHRFASSMEAVNGQDDDDIRQVELLPMPGRGRKVRRG